MVGNCMSVRLLGRSRRGAAGAGPPQITPKLVWLPVNPLIPPPWQLEPDFSAWHRRWVDAQREDQEAARARWRDAQWWFAQCSLASAAAVMEEQGSEGYVLLHLEHSFAVFVLRSLWPAVAPMVQETVQHGMGGPGGRPLAAGAGAAPLYDHWLRGWFCSPVAPTLFGLRHSSAVDLSVLHDRRAPPERQQRAVCAFAREQGLPAGQDRPAGGVRGRRRGRARAGGRGSRSAGGGGPSWRSWELQDPPEDRAARASSSRPGGVAGACRRWAGCANVSLHIVAAFVRTPSLVLRMPRASTERCCIILLEIVRSFFPTSRGRCLCCGRDHYEARWRISRWAFFNKQAAYFGGFKQSRLVCVC
ncbi:unnamed protein product [Prorocentrum cordatum]|uniref:Uncharacterized protein n=1 Tax=Prorocentrum cordatum TaxID=2364126 RepID=A0ABN9UGF1_9DINO|nr:unnamed protein product [Polarella glacialis]